MQKNYEYEIKIHKYSNGGERERKKIYSGISVYFCIDWNIQ